MTTRKFNNDDLMRAGSRLVEGIINAYLPDLATEAEVIPKKESDVVVEGTSQDAKVSVDPLSKSSPDEVRIDFDEPEKIRMFGIRTSEGKIAIVEVHYVAALHSLVKFPPRPGMVLVSNNLLLELA